jgi:lyso-ornithine lipid O-acyltransferase
MTSWLKHPLRVTGRLLWMAAELARAAMVFRFRRLGNASVLERSRWLQQTTRRLIRIIRLELEVSGPVPTSGLLVSNHTGYVDVLVLGSLSASVFVSRADVEHWPLFGWFAAKAGTIFVHRQRKIQTRDVNLEIEAVLKSGALVVLFPEGTSSDGRGVLPFKSSLLEPAARELRPIAVGAIEYRLDDGDPGNEVAYWGDAMLVPHLITLLSKRRVCAKVRFGCVAHEGADRKQLAQRLRTEVLNLKADKRVNA